MEPAGVGGGGSGSGLPRSQFGISPPLTVDAITDSQQVEAASPISSRPPAPSSLNYDELIRLSSTAQIDDALAGDDADRTGAAAAGNRWPRQETLALLKIRSDMDSTFRDATLKGPLWDEVSRKLADLGYNRSAKKCKEKFENVQKYYKRTKEGRGGRQDGKTYKFFTELEALHNAAAATTTTPTAAVKPSFSTPPTGFGISNPTPISSVKISPTTVVVSSQTPMGMFSPGEHFTVRPPPPPVAVAMGVSFSSNTSSASTEDDEEEEEMGFGVDLEGEPSSAAAGSSRKRRRMVVKGSGSRTHKMMMGFLEGLMKQVMHKQEVMQQKFLEAIEKREQDRMIREEKLKIQEMARLNREQERIAQERTISASRDAAIIDFLQKFTGQTIQLPVVNVSPPALVPPPAPPQLPVPVPGPVTAPVHMLVTAPAPVSVPVPLSPVPPPPLQPQNQKVTHIIENEIIPLDQFQEMSQLGGDGGMSTEPISSRWPKPEVLALIKLRGGLESKYQEMGPKGPLWEEISAGMQHMGYNRSAKRCKEKWENINKYFKKVKESNKKRRDDSKTCPYFNELDALYRKKILSVGGGSGGGGSDGGGSASCRSSFSDTSKFEQDPIKNMDMEMTPIPTHSSSINPQPQSQTTGLSASLFGEGTEEQPATSTKPEDIVNELMELQDLYHRPGSNNVDRNEDDYEDEEDYYSEDDDDDDDTPEDQKRNNKDNNMDYKIEFQRRRNAGNSNGVKSEFQSMAVVQ